MSAGVLIAPGPLAVEALLLEQVAPWLEQSARDPDQQAAPVRVVVPSQSLRAHVTATLARHFGALAGVRVQTLQLLALEIGASAGAELPRGELVFPILVRRLAAAEPALRERLHDLHDGYGVVSEAVTDLLDAGFEPAHADAAEEALLEAMGGVEAARTRAVLRVAVSLSASLHGAGLAHRSDLIRTARERVEARSAEDLHARALFLHGFTDATGVQAELIEALVRHADASVLLDHPPDPVDPDRVDPGLVFGERFAARVAGAAGEVQTGAVPGAPPAVQVLHAPGVQAEVRAVAGRIRALLDAGALPERIGVVARRLDAYGVPVRTHFARLGVPFSGVGGSGPPGPARRRVASLLGLLERRERTPTERWLDALERLPGEPRPMGPGLRADLLLGLHTLGASRVDEVALLRPEVDERGLALPVRDRLVASGEGGGGPATRRRLRGDRLLAAIEAAAAACRRWAAWPERAPLADHIENLLSHVRDDLGWDATSPGADEVRARLLESDLAAPPGFALERSELALFAERCLSAAAVERLGGKGGGVQVLDVMEARARTFDHLFVVGLNRDVFPRTITEDPLISDPVRRRLRDVLPDLPVKTEGTDEERHLFAQLLASAPQISLSCALCDDDGKARPVSPLLDRLRWARHVGDPISVPALLAARSLEEKDWPRPAHEHAALAGLYGTRARFGRALQVALAECAHERGLPGHDDGTLATARLAVLAELDPSRRRRRELGPYYGFVGRLREGADPRRSDLSITAVEAMARCPWQAFLRRVLHVEPVPDPHAELPTARDPRLIGILVHDVLEAIVRRALPETPRDFGEALAGEPAAIPWPGDAELEELVRSRAEACLRVEGIGLPGFARVLALHAIEKVRVARQLGWPDGESGVLAVGAELQGSAAVGEDRRILFRADRVDRIGSKLRIVDYKTGAPLARQQRPDARRRQHLRRVDSGKQLQTVAYARAGRELGHDEVEGRYLYLDECGRYPALEFDVRAGDGDFDDAFDAAVGAVLDAWDHGSFVPRLADHGSEEEPRSCERCEVKEACLRGDSGARQRLSRFSARVKDRGERPASERALLRVWELGAS